MKYLFSFRTYGVSALTALFCVVPLLPTAAMVPPYQPRIAPTNLRCEYLHDPLGLDAVHPRLGWTLMADRRAEHQMAYQVLAASSPEALALNKGDLWDSGKVASSEMSHIVYRGKALASRQACYWKVRVWDRDGKPGVWSLMAHWEMGLLKPTDWSAQWMNAGPVSSSSHAQTSPKIIKAIYEATDGNISKDVTVLVTDLVKNGISEITVSNKSLGGDPAPNHLKQLRVSYDDAGKTTEIVVPEDEILSLTTVPRAVPYLRKAFTLTKPIRQARLYVTALGLYEARVNGVRVGDHLLAPEWTDYNKRVRYQEYDVTGQLKVGENALGAYVANGWYAGHIGNGGFRHWGTTPALLAQLEVIYKDGSTQRIVSDATWKEHAGPIATSDFMLGETYDASREIANWDRPGLNDADWMPITTRDESARTLEGQVMEPVRQIGQIAAKTLTEPLPGHWTYDLGQNMVGVVRLKLSVPAGTRIAIHHAEMLNKDGSMYTTNLRGAPSVDTYVSKGGVQIWQPRFTFHGFRYVELTGLSAKPNLDAVTGIVIGSDTAHVGDFTCSDPRINQLQSNIQWGQRGNFLSVPTDCPQRDERLGWMGDAQVFVRTATYNADVAAFFTKWLVDVDDAQTADGKFPDVSPNTMGGGGVPAWADAGVICPWMIYQMYGDKRVLETHLPAMIRWVEWCRTHSTDLIRDKDRGSDYGDWLSIGANTPKDLIGTAYFAYSTHLTAQAARAVGHIDDADKYDQLFTDIKAAFNKLYVSPEGRITGDTQCAYAMALKFDLLSADMRAKAAQYLEDDVKAKDWHLSTGFVGVSYLLPTLTQSGKLDTAYRLLNQDTFPSWLFSVKQGATTIWERWDGWTPDKGFQNPGMNSFNHYSLGSCGEWLFDTVAGIGLDPAKPGFQHTIIRPRPGGGLTFAKGSLNSICGEIKSGWVLNNGKLTLNVTIPVNTTATVYVPATNTKPILESGKPVSRALGVTFLRQESDASVFEVGSGSYSFSVAH